jgi:hypothetical protein
MGDDRLTPIAATLTLLSIPSRRLEGSLGAKTGGKFPISGLLLQGKQLLQAQGQAAPFSSPG